VPVVTTGPRIVRISELAEQAGCEPDTVRHFESLGLLRSAGPGDRAFDDADVVRLRFIMRSRAEGLGIEDIRGLLRDAAHEQRSRPDVPSGPLIRKGRLRSGQ